MNCRTFSRAWGRFRMIFQAQNLRWWNVSSFSIGAKYIRVLSIPKGKNLKDWSRANLGAVPRKLNVWGHTLIFSLYFVWGNHSWSPSKFFIYALLINTLQRNWSLLTKQPTSMLYVCTIRKKKVVCTVRMVPCTIRTVHTTYAAALKTTTHPKTRCRKPYAATQHLMLLMMGVCTRNMSS